MLGGVKMYTYNDYCNIVNDNVEVNYEQNKVPILCKGQCNGSIYIKECSHIDECNVSSSHCPIFLKLNNL